MLNLAEILCLVLVATATSAAATSPVPPTQKDFDTAIKVSLMKVKMSYLPNLNCIRWVKLNLRLKVKALVPALMDSSRLEFFDGASQGSFVVDDPDLYTGNLKVDLMGVNDLKNNMGFIDQIHNVVEGGFHAQREMIKSKQVWAGACAYYDPDDSHDSLQAASCLNQLKEVLDTIVENAKANFSQLCRVAKIMAHDTLNSLEQCISTQ